MDKRFVILDERGNWHGPSRDAARARGYETHRIERGHQAPLGGLGFIRPHAIPAILERNHLDYTEMAERLTMVQDFDQVEVYDDKSAQFFRWARWMPRTWRFDRLENALGFARTWPVAEWIVSKADVGASSKNVRILKSRKDLIDHIRLAFGRGIEVDHCAGGRGNEKAHSKQRGYVLLQQFIPHDCTWRVNAIGRGRAMFKRFNGPEGKAQTGNVEPVKDYGNAVVESVLSFANHVFAELGTRWCALDVLMDGDTPRLLETSLGWPWPSPGDCDNAPFVGVEKTYLWRDMWDLMLDEYEAGVWSRDS